MQESYGRVTIAPDVLVTIARLTTQSVEGVARMCPVGPGFFDKLFKRIAGGGGVRIAVNNDTVRVDLYIVVQPYVNMRAVSQHIQTAATRAIQDMVGMKVSAVNVHIQDVTYGSQRSPDA